jgi:hypothetical protein
VATFPPTVTFCTTTLSPFGVSCTVKNGWLLTGTLNGVFFVGLNASNGFELSLPTGTLLLTWSDVTYVLPFVGIMSSSAHLSAVVVATVVVVSSAVVVVTPAVVVVATAAVVVIVAGAVVVVVAAVVFVVTAGAVVVVAELVPCVVGVAVGTVVVVVVGGAVVVVVAARGLKQATTEATTLKVLSDGLIVL